MTELAPAIEQVSWDDWNAAVDLDDIHDRSRKQTDNADKASNKRLMGASFDDQMQLEPIKYHWAWEFFLDAERNFWLPTEVGTTDDVQQWNDPNKIPEEDRRLVKQVLGYFATVENAIANNAVWVVHKHITNPEARMFLTMQASMESIHQHAYTYCIEALGVDKHEAYNAMNTVPEVKEKIMWAADKTAALDDPNFIADTVEKKREFLLNLVCFMLCEGIQFFGGFAMMLNMNRRNLLPGVAKMIQYIARDETQHCAFYTALINAILEEHPELGGPEFEAKCIQYAEEAVVAEIAFIYTALDARGSHGMPRRKLVDYIRYLGCDRLRGINIKPPKSLMMDFDATDHPMPWLDEVLYLRKEGNFFETRVTEYRADGLRWDDRPAKPAVCNLDDEECEACQ